jgi:hypothetical protein
MEQATKPEKTKLSIVGIDFQTVAIRDLNGAQKVSAKDLSKLIVTVPAGPDMRDIELIGALRTVQEMKIMRASGGDTAEMDNIRKIQRQMRSVLQATTGSIILGSTMTVMAGLTVGEDTLSRSKNEIIVPHAFLLHGTDPMDNYGTFHGSDTGLHFSAIHNPMEKTIFLVKINSPMEQATKEILVELYEQSTDPAIIKDELPGNVLTDDEDVEGNFKKIAELLLWSSYVQDHLSPLRRRDADAPGMFSMTHEMLYAWKDLESSDGKATLPRCL